MKIQTLKELIQVAHNNDTTENVYKFKETVFQLIDLYEQDMEFTPTPGFTVDYTYTPSTLPWGTYCVDIKTPVSQSPVPVDPRQYELQFPKQ